MFYITNYIHMLTFAFQDYQTELSHAANLDPLELGHELGTLLPELNERADVNELERLGGRATEAALDIDCIEQPRVADAALRDLDFIAGSLVRHGSNPQHITGLNLALSHLGAVAGTVPRGTVYTYTTQNPKEQERSFTGSAREQLFIDVVRDSGSVMLSACGELLAIDAAHDESEDIAEILVRVAESMGSVVKNMVIVKREISPEFFTFTMRPYFEPIEINGISYAGAGGAQLPLVIIDRLLWGVGFSSTDYKSYFADNVRYQPATLRADLSVAENQQYGENLLGTLRTRHFAGDDLKTAFEGVELLLKKLRGFRMPHRRVAEDNFKLRAGAAVGSGQYTPSILTDLIDWTEEAINTAKSLKVSYDG
jgi:hypothetical protein